MATLEKSFRACVVTSVARSVAGSGGGGEPAVVGPDRNVVNGYSVPLSSASIATSWHLDGATSGARLAVSTSSDMSSPIYSSPANTTNNTVKHVITGLSPATKYYYCVEVNGTLKTGNINSCWTAPAKSGFSPFHIATGFCGANYGNNDKSTVLKGLLQLANPPKLFLHMGDFIYTNPYGTDPALYEEVFNGAQVGQYLGPVLRHCGLVYMFDDHDWHQNNSSEFISQDTTGTPVYEVLDQADLIVAAEVHRRRNPIPVSYRAVATSDGKNNSFAIDHGPCKIIAADSRSKKVWQTSGITFAANYTDATEVTVTCDFGASASGLNRPWPGYEFEPQTGIPAGTKITAWGGIPSGTGVLTYTLTLSHPVTVANGTVATTTGRYLGRTQLDYVKSQFADAAANDLDVLLVWPSGMNWFGWQDVPLYNMPGQKAEILELYDYISDLDWHQRTIVICGDIHSTQVDSGFNCDQGTYGRTRIPIWRVGALEASGINAQSIDFDIYDEVFTSRKNTGCGYITVTDNGNGTRTYALVGYECNRLDDTDFGLIPDLSHSVTLPQSDSEPFSNGVSIAQTWLSTPSRNTEITFAARYQPAEGNLMVLVVGQQTGNASSGSVGNGWTLSQTFYDTSGVCTFVFTKIATVGESQTISLGSWRATGTSQDAMYIELESDTGWHASLINATAHDPHTGTSRQTVTCDITTTQADCAVLVIGTADSSAYTFGPVTGFERIMNTPAWNRPRTLIGAANMPTSGTLTLARTITHSTSPQHLCAIAFRKDSDTPVAPSNSVAPVVSGTTTVGETLTSTTGTWSGTAPITYSYQWKRGTTSVGTNLSTYTPVTGDIGENMTCEVTATNAAGSDTAASNSVGPVSGASAYGNAVSVDLGTTTTVGTGPTLGAINSGYANWTWQTGTPNVSVTNLQDQTGTPTTLDLTTTNAGGNSTTRVAGSGDAFNMLTRGVAIINSPNVMEIALAQIPYASYDIVVYIEERSGNSAGKLLSVSDGTTTYYAQTDTASQYSGSWVRVTSTNSGTPSINGNYVHFETLSGASKTISLQSTSALDWVISGIQIIERL